ncbi:MAG: hypothetical protein ACJ790_16445 [Myxococcaceae bacterium]
MRNDWLRPLGFFVVFGFLGVVLYASLPKLLGSAAGPDAEIVSYIKNAERDGIRFPGAPPLLGKKVFFDRITVTVDADAHTAEAVATLDFDGTFGETKVSSLGYEKIRFKFADGSWAPEGLLAPRLLAIVSALERRRAALEKGDSAAMLALGGEDGGAGDLDSVLAIGDRHYTARAWFIRSERDTVLVTEEARVRGKLPERPVDEDRTIRLTLEPAKSGGEFFFPHGLM